MGVTGALSPPRGQGADGSGRSRWGCGERSADVMRQTSLDSTVTLWTRSALGNSRRGGRCEQCTSIMYLRPDCCKQGMDEQHHVGGRGSRPLRVEEEVCWPWGCERGGYVGESMLEREGETAPNENLGHPPGPWNRDGNGYKLAGFCHSKPMPTK